ncbi:hypothetical protein DM01DRAFT_330773 [Hesseltinella vesiculosa]|uniref:Myb-like domain-containing protein n=1 Tax=Hesseltinella vesiculosa TaxID=101127 RepID=A0A1X2G682_9FUNG|nr:hypothetical protein DM01DRAFT_330773 [Hesseltinella vesiculosa]
MGDRDWQEIATLVGDRSGQQCLHRWLKSINPTIRCSPWNKEEDDALRGAVAVFSAIPDRIDMQCRERGVNVLEDNLKFGPFSEEGNALLVKLVAEHGCKWSLPSQFLPGRTDNSVLRQWRVLERMESQAKETAQPTHCPPPTPSSSSSSTSTSTATPEPIPPCLIKAPPKRQRAATKRKPPTKSATAAPIVTRSLRSRKGNSLQLPFISNQTPSF